jgi:hypothetical protein
LFAEITSERTNIEESYEGEKFANAVLQWSSGQAPFMVGFQRKASLG